MPGKYNVLEGQENCTKCAINTYAPTTEMTACIDCDIGRIAKPGSVECSVCGTGKIKIDLPSTVGLYRCETCAWGKFAQAGDSACSNCSSGFYQPESGSGECVPCVAGKFSSTNGAVTPDVCRSCTAGKYSGAVGQAAESSCNNCPPGTASTTNGSTSVSFCLSCAVGKASVSGSVACVDCEAGKFQAQKKQMLCLPCVPGTYQNEVGATSCLQCPVDTFANTTRQSSCTKCPIGKQADFIGSAQCQVKVSVNATIDNSSKSLLFLLTTINQMTTFHPSKMHFRCAWPASTGPTVVNVASDHFEPEMMPMPQNVTRAPLDFTKTQKAKLHVCLACQANITFWKARKIAPNVRSIHTLQR